MGSRSKLFYYYSTCYESRLSHHLKVCNAKRLADSQPSYIVKGINLGDVNEQPKHIPLSTLTQDTIDTVIRKVHAAYGSNFILFHNLNFLVNFA